MSSTDGADSSPMKISTLEYFIATAESGSINEAAKKLFIAQPSLTKALQLMEEELGVHLFIRKRTGVELTPEGARILEEARQVVGYYKGWKELGSTQPLPRITIYSHISIAGFLIPEIMLRFRSKYPGLHIRYQADAQPERYISRDPDRPVISLCLCHNDSHTAGLSKKQGNEPFVLANGYYGCLLNKDDPLAARGKISFQDLKRHVLILPDTESEHLKADGISAPTSNISAISDFFPALMSAVLPDNVITVESVSTVIKMVTEQTGVFALSFSPAHLRYPSVRSEDVVNVPFYEDETKADLCLFCSQADCRRYPEMRDLVNEIRYEMQNFLGHSMNA